jgi:hypothetical protein
MEGGPTAAPLYVQLVTFTPSGPSGTETGSAQDFPAVSGSVGLPVTSTTSGTAGTPSSAVQTIQGIAGGTAIATTSPAPITEVTGQQAASTSAALFWAARTTGSGTGAVRNLDTANTAFIGPAGVTAANGFALPPGAGATFDPRLAQYVICSAGTPVISYIGAY